jgi:hypothetical protein
LRFGEAISLPLILGIDAHLSHWKADCYKHYTVSLLRKTVGGHRSLVFIFACRHQESAHPDLPRARANTSHGTTNLRNNAANCVKRRGKLGLFEDSTEGASQPQIDHAIVSLYSPHKFQAMIAIDAAVSNEPFNRYGRKWLGKILTMLLNTVVVNSGATISRHVSLLYKELSLDVASFLKVSGFQELKYELI